MQHNIRIPCPRVAKHNNSILFRLYSYHTYLRFLVENGTTFAQTAYCLNETLSLQYVSHLLNEYNGVPHTHTHTVSQLYSIYFVYFT